MKEDIFNTDKKYDIIYADPPWAYRNMGNIQATANSHYSTMKQEDIEALPIGQLAKSNSILFMWATFPKMQEALNTIKAWGFEYKTIAFAWQKLTKSNTPITFMGAYTMKSGIELCLLATKGKEAHKLVKKHNVRALIQSQRQEHSKKPIEVKERIIELVGDLPRIELFAREKTHGFDVWGNEVACDINLNN